MVKQRLTHSKLDETDLKLILEKKVKFQKH